MTAAGSRSAHARKTPSLRQFVPCEKETQFESRGIFRIGTVDRIMLNIRSPLLADGAFLGIGWVSGAHQLPQIGDGIFFFESQNNNGPARHKVSECAEKRPAGVHRIELLSLVFRDFKHLYGEDAEGIFLELFNDVADGVLSYGVRFDDSKSTL